MDFTLMPQRETPTSTWVGRRFCVRGLPSPAKAKLGVVRRYGRQPGDKNPLRHQRVFRSAPLRLATNHLAPQVAVLASLVSENVVSGRPRRVGFEHASGE